MVYRFKRSLSSEAFLIAVILGYCLAVFLVAIVPDVQVTNTKAMPKVLADSDVKFHASPNAPDPNVAFNMVNERRQKEGIEPLAVNNYLAAIARQRAEDMSSQSYYAHKNPAGLYYHQVAGSELLSYVYSCENLALDFVLTEESYVNAWISSQSHKNCLLSSKSVSAGYASAEFENINGGQRAFIIVAIHAAL